MNAQSIAANVLSHLLEMAPGIAIADDFHDICAGPRLTRIVEQLEQDGMVNAGYYHLHAQHLLSWVTLTTKGRDSARSSRNAERVRPVPQPLITGAQFKIMLLEHLARARGLETDREAMQLMIIGLDSYGASDLIARLIEAGLKATGEASLVHDLRRHYHALRALQ